jgi:hypothetical protein
MSGPVIVYVIFGLVVVAAAVTVWMVDARRNRDVHVEHQRFETDPNRGDPGIDQMPIAGESEEEAARRQNG